VKHALHVLTEKQHFRSLSLHTQIMEIHINPKKANPSSLQKTPLPNYSCL